MNCAEARLLLDGAADATLAGGARRALDAHLAACAPCRSDAARAGALAARLEALPRAIVPARDLWPAIAEQIAGSNVVAAEFAARARRRVPLGLAAAAAALLIAATSVVTAVLVRGERPSRVAATAPAGEPGAVQASLALADARATYEGARRQLLAALTARRGALSPATLKVVDDNLEIIDRAVREMEGALARDPGNPELPALLVTAYRQEIDVLQRAAALPARG